MSWWKHEGIKTKAIYKYLCFLGKFRQPYL